MLVVRHGVARHAGCGPRALALPPLDDGGLHAVEVGLPDHHQLVRAARREEVPVLGEPRRVHRARVALQREEQAALAQVPDLE